MSRVVKRCRGAAQTGVGLPAGLRPKAPLQTLSRGFARRRAGWARRAHLRVVETTPHSCV